MGAKCVCTLNQDPGIQSVRDQPRAPSCAVLCVPKVTKATYGRGRGVRGGGRRCRNLDGEGLTSFGAGRGRARKRAEMGEEEGCQRRDSSGALEDIVEVTHASIIGGGEGAADVRRPSQPRA